jgi:hypothetical protein
MLELKAHISLQELGRSRSVAEQHRLDKYASTVPQLDITLSHSSHHPSKPARVHAPHAQLIDGRACNRTFAQPSYVVVLPL